MRIIFCFAFVLKVCIYRRKLKHLPLEKAAAYDSSLGGIIQVKHGWHGTVRGGNVSREFQTTGNFRM